MLRNRDKPSQLVVTLPKKDFLSKPPPSARIMRLGGKLNLLLRFSVAVVLFVYVVVPLVFFSSPWLRRSLIFMNYMNLSPKINLSSPPIDCFKNFYLQSEPGVIVGMWHLPPKTIACKEGFQDDHPVILYLHGSGGTRGSLHRRNLYDVLTGPGVAAHVISLDYRGFGDSTNKVVNVKGLVQDATVVYNWIMLNVPNKRRVFVWGHSMGTGVATHLVSQLPLDKSPAGLVLEASFTTMPEAVASHPLSFIHRKLPYFKFLFMDPIEHSETFFNNQARIRSIKVPLLLLHAEDDELLDHKFSTILKEKSGSKYIKFHSYNSTCRYGHKYIFRDPRLPEKIANFLHKSTLYQFYQ